MNNLYVSGLLNGGPQFPLERVPEIIRNAIIGAGSKTKAPVPLIFASAMAPVSLLCQGLTDISPAEGLTFPVSCNFCTVAESGERKSTVDKLFMAPIHEFEHEAGIRYGNAIQLYETEREIWEEELKALKSTLNKLVKKNQPTEEIKESIRAHRETIPQEPFRIQLLASDITPAALQFQLHKGGGSIGLHSAEGDIILGGQAIQNLGLLNDLWDGASFTVSRRCSESFSVHGARLSASLMVQDAPLRKYFKRAQQQARGSGFLARFFFARPDSTIGTRTGPALEEYKQLLAPYHRRLQQLIEDYAHKTETKVLSDRQKLIFTPEARLRWGDIGEYLEREMAENGCYYSLRDFASKEGNKVARLAALFHYFNGDAGDIPEKTLLDAQKVSEWYLGEALYLFGTKPEQPQHVQDAVLLWRWLHDRFMDNNGQPLTRSWMSPRVPNLLRTPGRLQPALEHLHNTYRISMVHNGRTLLIAPFNFRG
ncbi:YfjI family protein [Klebsiella michiganensis]|uniref:YfjI family protein n=1 Tax=Klebsiella michiganensis TaxID=1134687 RepID=UPI002246A2D0|nr:YfjI family protein [Klebsiella michiganensis]MCW9614089.1 YfjI family protein [Klebsiella michiganensis]